ncbi:hypothetical protein [Micromonospora sp. LOL_024]|uniref:hypothetical protein n=1 Tax=Micromonospora sp. LOL_024 TaxID=3345412 RepID=UPI003A85B4D3
MGHGQGRSQPPQLHTGSTGPWLLTAHHQVQVLRIKGMTETSPGVGVYVTE